MIDLLSLNGHIILTKIRWRWSLQCLGWSGRGTSCSWLTSRTPTSRYPFIISLDFYHQIVLGRRVYKFKTVGFCLSTVPQVFYQCLLWVWNRFARGGIQLHLSGWQVGDCGVCSSLASTSQATPSALPGLGVVINMEKSDLEPTSKVQYLGMLIDTMWEGVFLTASRIVRFWDLAARFLLLLASLAKMWQQLLSHMASMERFVSLVWTKMCPLQWQLKTFWWAASDNPAKPVSGFRRRGGHQEIPSGCPSLSSPLHWWVDYQLGMLHQDLLAVGIWSWEDSISMF